MTTPFAHSSTMHSRSIALLFALTVTVVSAVTISYYDDTTCNKLSTLPIGISNPIVAPLNSCGTFGATSLKYSTCNPTDGIKQQSYTDGNCANPDGSLVTSPGAAIGVCVPISATSSAKYTCSSGSVLSASLLAFFAAMIAVLF